MLILSSIIGLYLPLVLRDLIDNNSSKLSFLNILAIGVLFLTQALLVSLGNIVIARYGEKIVLDLRTKIIIKILPVKMPFFFKQKQVISFPKLPIIRLWLTNFTPLFIRQLLLVLTLIGTLIILSLLDIHLALTIFISFPVLGILLIPFSRFSEKNSEKLQLEMSLFSGDLMEYVKEMELIKARNAE